MSKKYWLVTEERKTRVYSNPDELGDYESPLRSEVELSISEHANLEEARDAVMMADVAAGEEGCRALSTIVTEYKINDKKNFSIRTPIEGGDKTKKDYRLLSRFLEERVNSQNKIDELQKPSALGTCDNCEENMPEMDDRKLNDAFFLKTNINSYNSTEWEFHDEQCLIEFLNKL